MMKRFAFALATLAGLAACAAEPEPQAQPDPALVARVAETAAPAAPKLDKADRIAAAVDRSDPDRLAAPAEALLER